MANLLVVMAPHFLQYMVFLLLGFDTSVVETKCNHLSVVHVGCGALRVPVLGLLVVDSPDVGHIVCLDLGCLYSSCFESLVVSHSNTLADA